MKLSIRAAALAAILPLAACGSGPSDSEVSKALNAYVAAMVGPQKSEAVVKDSKCEKASDGDAYECDIALGGGDFAEMAGPTHHARLAKLGGDWKIVSLH